jgi:hypothetical protein
MLEEERGNCVSKCISQECYKEVYSHDPLEDGEIDNERQRVFLSCTRRVYRERKKVDDKNRAKERRERYNEEQGIGVQVEEKEGGNSEEDLSTEAEQARQEGRDEEEEQIEAAIDDQQVMNTGLETGLEDKMQDESGVNEEEREEEES